MRLRSRFNHTQASSGRVVTVVLVGAYLAAVVVANLLVAAFGPAVVVPNSLVLIALDLTARDVLHERWRGRGLWLRMAALVGAGGLLSYLANPMAGRVALASCVAFVTAGAADTVAYRLLDRQTWLARMNGSNVVAAAVDSIVFPTLAFGGLLPLVVTGQFAAKVLGGLCWSLLVTRRQVAEAMRA